MMTKLHLTIDRLLHEADGESLCDPCLAFASAAPLIEVVTTAQRLSDRTDVYRAAGHCASCRRESLVTVIRPLAHERRPPA
jgi:hypothetical protein